MTRQWQPAGNPRIRGAATGSCRGVGPGGGGQVNGIVSGQASVPAGTPAAASDAFGVVNTLANEYPDFGGNYEVIHHSELLSSLVRDGRVKPAKAQDSQPITYHDSCYLARHNDVLEAPREIVSAVAQPVEMERSRKETFCCGAGGAHMWMEERAKPINEERVREAAATGAGTLAVACPFCTVMLDDGVQSAGADLRVVDVATLLSEAIDDGG